MRPDAVIDAPTQPLISSRVARNDLRSSRDATQEGDSRGNVWDSEDEEDIDDRSSSPTSFVWMLTVAAGLSGLLFGYDTGVISSTLVAIRSDLGGHALTTLDKSLITASTSFFALVASPCAGFVADAIGRKHVIFLASCVFVAGALVQAFSTNVMGMIIGRSIIGLGVGAASFVAPLYIGELSPREWRGRLVTILSLFITGGQVVAYVVGWLFSEAQGGWRWMVGLGALPAGIQAVVLVFMPETARWLVKAGKPGEAEKVLTKVYGFHTSKAPIIASVLHAIQREVLEEDATAGKDGNSNALADLVRIGRNRRALVISCLLQAGQQLCGFNSLMYFSATIFSLVGFKSPTLTSLSIAVTNFVFTLVAFSVIDWVGRRRILLTSLPWMVIGLALCALSFGFLDLPADMTSNSGTAQQGWPAVFLVLSLILYVSAFALGLGNVPWQQGELFPLRVRSVGSSLSTATNWLSNTIVGLTFLPMMDFLTPSVTFGLYAVICALTWIGIWCCYPETAGLRLEDVGALLEHSYGVQESMARWTSVR